MGGANDDDDDVGFGFGFGLTFELGRKKKSVARGGGSASAVVTRGPDRTRRAPRTTDDGASGQPRGPDLFAGATL